MFEWLFGSAQENALRREVEQDAKAAMGLAEHRERRRQDEEVHALWLTHRADTLKESQETYGIPGYPVELIDMDIEDVQRDRYMLQKHTFNKLAYYARVTAEAATKGTP